MRHLAGFLGAAMVVLTACSSASDGSTSISARAVPMGQIVFDTRPLGAEDPEIAFVVSADGTNEHRLDLPGLQPVWSPDGSELSVSTSHGPAIAEPDGSGLSSYLPDTGLGWCIWSPDGTRLLCQRTDAGALDGLYSIRSSDGGERVRLTASPYHDVTGSAGECGGGDVPGDYSPDGTRFVFTRTRCGTGPDPSRDQTTALYVMNADGTGMERIEPYGAVGVEDDRPTWSPDGGEILFAGSDCALHLEHPDGTGHSTIPIDGCAWNPEWSPDGTWIAFDLNVPLGSPDLFVAWLDGTHLTRITHTPQRIEMLASWGAVPS